VSDVVRLRFSTALWLFLAPRHRRADPTVVPDGTSSLGHLVESLGVPLPEVGALVVNGRAARPSYRPVPGDVVMVEPVTRPQPLPFLPPRFLLDVHLGALTRRLRLLGIDTAYRSGASDDELIALADDTSRVLLTQDRGLLRRRAVSFGAYVYGARPDDQLRDVLDRFALPVAPWTRCLRCNGLLHPVAKEEIAHLLEPGTRRSFDRFAQCGDCDRVYWRGAHAARLEELIKAVMSPARPEDREGSVVRLSKS
jgi:hypothetical protein